MNKINILYIPLWLLIIAIAYFMPGHSSAQTVSLVQSNTVANGSSNNVTATFSATPTEGNLLIAIPQTRDGNTGNTSNIVSSGWTKVTDNYFQSSTADRRGFGYYFRIAGASESSTVNTNWSSGVRGSLTILEFSVSAGFNFVGFLEESNTNSGGSTAASITATLGSLSSVTRFAQAVYLTRETPSNVTFSGGFGNQQNHDSSPGGDIGMRTATQVTTSTSIETTVNYDESRLSNLGIFTFQIAEDGEVVCPTESSQSSVNEVLANRVERPEFSYTVESGQGSGTYTFGVGTDNDLLLEAFEVEETLNFGIDRIADRIELRRRGITGQGPSGEERHILFFEQAPGFSSTNRVFRGGFFPTMEEALVCTCINRGADNVFANNAGTNENNIQRLDYIFDDGIVVPADPAEAGFPVFERGGNDPLKLAVIHELDGSGDPSEFGCVKSYTPSDWEPTGFDITASVLSGFPNDGGNLVETASLSSQSISVIFVSFEDLGLSPGEIIYGYSLAAGDATTDSEEFLNFNNTSFFPVSDETDGGLDLLSGGSFSRRAYIHTQDGWYNGEDPNDFTTNCDDLLTITGGTAQINSAKTFKEISAVNGNLNLGGNTIDVCENINTRFPFTVSNGTIRFNGTVPQRITGPGNILSIDSFILDNDEGLVVDSPTEVFDYVLIEDGSIEVQRDFTFKCDFSGSNPKTAMIGPLLGSSTITGNVTTEQCFPARRAFRLVSPSLTTTSSIRANWQEGAESWDTFNEQDVPREFGTHITGLGVQNASPTNDGQNGFDWQPSGNPSMFTYDNINEQYSPISNTNTNTLQAGEFYRLMIRGDRHTDIRFNFSDPSDTRLRETGTILKGPYSPPNATIPTNPSSGRVFMVGNPFQSIVDLSVVYENSSNIQPFVAIWDPTLGGTAPGNPDSQTLGGRGGFVVVDMRDGTSSNSTSNMDQFQQVKQAIFFYANGNGTPVINYGEPDKRIFEDQTTVFSMPESQLQINLYDKASFDTNDTADDGVKIKFKADGNNLVDQWDAKKISNQDENLARMFGNHLLSIEERAFPIDNEILPLFINQYRDTEYVFVINNIDLPQGTIAYLRDNYLDTLTELEEGVNIINFQVDPSVNASTAFHRFSIVFEVETLSVGEFNNNNFSVYPNPLEGSDLWVEVDGLSGEEALVQIYDTLGRMVKTFNQQVESNGKIHLNNIQLNQGLYLLELTSGGKKYMSKFVKK